MNNTKSIHARFFGLLRQMPHTSKEELVKEYSSNKSSSLSWFSEIMPRDYERMINDMQRIVDSMKKQSSTHRSLSAQQSKGTASAVTKKYRSAILHRLQKHGVDTTRWANVNSFMENPRIAGKRLYDMSDAEMIDFIPKMESILKKDKQHQAETERLTLMN